MSFQMTKEEIVRATSLLDAEDAVLFAQSNLGGGHWLTPEGYMEYFPQRLRQ